MSAITTVPTPSSTLSKDPLDAYVLGRIDFRARHGLTMTTGPRAKAWASSEKILNRRQRKIS